MDKRAQMKCALRKATEQGRAEGELNKALETARNLKNAGISVDIICQCTSLTPEQVAAL